MDRNLFLTFSESLVPALQNSRPIHILVDCLNVDLSNVHYEFQFNNSLYGFCSDVNAYLIGRLIKTRAPIKSTHRA